MTHPPFVPSDFVEPPAPSGGTWFLAAIDASRSDEDYLVWTSSIDHIARTPGFPDDGWPDPRKTAAQSRAEIRRHVRDHAARAAFTYSVHDRATGAIIGCVYVWPPRDGVHDADVRLWLCAERADDDAEVARVVLAWLRTSWPFTHPDVPGRQA